MPIYSYECSNPKCVHSFDVIQPHYDTEKDELCPECGQPAKFCIPIGSRSKVKFLFNYIGPSEN